ncbi:MAG: YlxM family DNA-binding protein [Clostridia bacterium]|nr:YlxM family DNA-binding protein [Clostridia bacterium]
MDDRIEIGWLLSFYGPLLTERQRKLISLYCEEDYSLSEIADREGISRQGVYDAVRRGARQLEAYEQQLGLMARYQRLTQGLSDCLALLENAPGEQAQRTRLLLETLLSQEEE